MGGLQVDALGCAIPEAAVAQSLVVEAVERGPISTFRVRGVSMHPTIEDGDVVTVAPLGENEPRIGDIVLFQSGSDLCTHRVMRLVRDATGGVTGVQTIGDARGIPDEDCGIQNVVGTVVEVQSTRGAWSPQAFRPRAEGRARLFLFAHPRVARWLRAAKRRLAARRPVSGAGVASPTGSSDR